MDEIGKIKGSELNPVIWSEAIRQSGGLDKMKKGEKEEKPSHFNMLDERGEMGEKPDIIRQTHIKIFHDNMAKSEIDGHIEAKENVDQNVRVKEVQEEYIEKAEMNEDLDEEGGKIGKEAVAITQRDIQDLAGLGSIGIEDLRFIIENYLDTPSGSYVTPQGYKMSVFRDDKTGNSYFSFIIPLDDGNMEQLSIFVNPKTPDKAQIFSRNLIEKK